MPTLARKLPLILASSEDGPRRHYLLELRLDDVPQLVVLLAEQDDGAGTLGVERRGAVLDGILDEGAVSWASEWVTRLPRHRWYDVLLICSIKRTAHNISLVDESSPPALPTKGHLAPISRVIDYITLRAINRQRE